MPAIKSLEELKRVREEALHKKQMKAAAGNVQVIVAMGTCGIAAGARDTMKSVLNFIEKNNLSGVTVTQTGCMGMCEQEPILQVVIGEGAKVVYGKVNTEIAEQIMKQHVQNGTPVKDYVLPI
ncbi:MAG: (2Fe-2S) ferredoxin domain-containing protein [Anaerolineales bacterium]|jgi:NADP-reducing hydrogenase subunit HndB|uniref:(2Fe-2S) ferredoxin domain-containing protein n=1 Tax=Candidatus Villigracilis proximus TaxID=3140683 RepID=UPI0031370C4C|nr:(2Fe-2S) ferredoxin domain-containing protein [Anaerolineales bacterium]MBK8823011.1 (2Fe-2S) ferredoxin domain-containing protein [Anaerolineales bacterium]MBK9207762.1 (2Fe-2S) ferredoxin domain-containing protein [Anaerolineales bacterium]